MSTDWFGAVYRHEDGATIMVIAPRRERPTSGMTVLVLDRPGGDTALLGLRPGSIGTVNMRILVYPSPWQYVDD